MSPIQTSDTVPIVPKNSPKGTLGSPIPLTNVEPRQLANRLPNGVASEGAIQSKAETFISERSIGESRPLKVIYIGAGVSGIVAAIEFLKNVPDLELVIYEKNPDVGGTWFENRYPGCACG